MIIFRCLFSGFKDAYLLMNYACFQVSKNYACFQILVNYACVECVGWVGHGWASGYGRVRQAHGPGRVRSGRRGHGGKAHGRARHRFLGPSDWARQVGYEFFIGRPGMGLV